MAIEPVASIATDTAVETPDPWVSPPVVTEDRVVSLTGHHALFPIDEIVRRLADRALMPSSQISTRERQLIDDVLAALMPKLDYGHRAMLCERFLSGADVPRRTVRQLAKDDDEPSRELLQKSPALCDFDLEEILRAGIEAQQKAIAGRKHLSAHTIATVLSSAKSPAVVKELLANESVVIPDALHNQLVGLAAGDDEIVRVLLQRSELGPGDAFDLFWYAAPKERAAIVKKFTVDRRAIDFGSIPDMAQALDTLKPETIAALEIIAGPQRKSAFDPEAALEAIQHGHADQFFTTLEEGAGLSHGLVRKIVADVSGEPLAILCKALQFGRSRFLIVLNLFQKAWNVNGEADAQAERLTMIYDSLSVDRADLILRYWNYDPRQLSD